MRIRRGPATVTGDAHRGARTKRAATDSPTAGREGAEGRPGSQETCLRPKAHKPSWKGVGSMLISRRISLALGVALSRRSVCSLPWRSRCRDRRRSRFGSRGLIRRPSCFLHAGDRPRPTPVVKDGGVDCTAAPAPRGALQRRHRGQLERTVEQRRSTSTKSSRSRARAMRSTTSSSENYYWSFWLEQQGIGRLGLCEVNSKRRTRCCSVPDCFGTEVLCA